MRQRVIVNLRVEGIHSWPDCPHEDVAFLRHPHRHMFHIRAEKDVSHGDREIEIIRLKRQIMNDPLFAVIHWDSRSCEDVAKYLYENYDLSYCEVLEDGENGGSVGQR